MKKILSLLSKTSLLGMIAFFSLPFISPAHANLSSSHESELKRSVIKMRTCTYYDETKTISFLFHSSGKLDLTVNTYASKGNGYGYGHGYGYGQIGEGDLISSEKYKGDWIVQGEDILIRTKYTNEKYQAVLITPKDKTCSFAY